jgi:hypothetical protein
MKVFYLSTVTKQRGPQPLVALHRAIYISSNSLHLMQTNRYLEGPKKLQVNSTLGSAPLT